MRENNMNTLEMKINSRDVAVMMEVEHGKLIRKIDGINEDFNQAEIGVVKYWIESTYQDRKNETRRCFEITKLGCDFLANKSTGTKGNLFTARYMDKFEEMKHELENRKIDSYMIDDPVKRAKRWIEEYEYMLEQKKQLEIAKPKVEYVDNVLKSDSLVSVTQIAKDFGKSALWLNNTLNELGVQYKRRNQWLLYSKYQDKEYVHSSTYTNGEGFSTMNTKWTQKGRKFIIDLLNKEGYYTISQNEI